MNMVEDDEHFDLNNWLKDVKLRHDCQVAHIQFLANTNHLDEAGFRALDSTLKKLTSFMKKLKTIGTAVTPTSLLPELEKLNVSKFLDEIAANICEAKLKTSDIPQLVEFCVKVSSLYAAFSGFLVAELRKHIPSKKSDTIFNPSKLRVDLRVLAELVLHGVLGKEGMQLLGAALSFITSTDKSEHVNVSILMPLCRVLFFDLTGVVPHTQRSLAEKLGVKIPAELSSKLLRDDQKTAVVNLFRSYFDSLLDHLNNVRVDMNTLRKSIRRQERTRGDASAEDRQKFDQIKTSYGRLLQSATDMSECLGCELPVLFTEGSDDEVEETKKLNDALAGGTLRLWPDTDTQMFYERLVDVSRLCKVGDDREEADDYFAKQEISESVNSVDLDNLDTHSLAGHSQAEDVVEDEDNDEENNAEEATNEVEDFSKMSEMDLMNRGASSTAKEFFSKLTYCINRNLIDNAAIEFLTHFRNKSHCKSLVQHLLKPPMDRFDLLPFYGRFLATIRPILPNVTMQVAHELLRIFREYTKRLAVPMKKNGAKKRLGGRIGHKVHVCNYISELVKFSILPKAEALACLRSLLVDLKAYKIDMFCAMIESMGLYLYRLPETHAKMSVIMQVLRNKSISLKDPRQQILLDNAYFSVIPPDEQITPHNRLPPIQEFLQMKIISTENRLNFFRKINWDDEEIAGFVLKLFSNPCRVRFDDLDRLASLISAISDYQEWVGICVVDDVLEFIRLFLEENHPSLQQRGFSSVIYLGQLFNYNVCGTTLIMKVLYQLITFGIRKGDLADDLIVRIQRVRLVCELINVVGEFFCKGSFKTKMDAFLVFFLRFHYENEERWKELADELGELPYDINYAVRELLDVWRKNDNFPASLKEANDAVVNLEKQYKTKVEEILQNIYEQHDDEKKEEKRLNCIMEEDEEEEDVEHDKPNDMTQGSEDVPDNFPTDEGDIFGNEDADENIRVRTQKREIQPEDEDFLRDFDRMMAESMQATHVPLKGLMTDLEVPPLARQKFERRITFASRPKGLPNRKTNANNNTSLLPSMNDDAEQTTSREDADFRQLQMALMTRGKKGTVLKAVRIESTENMHERWRSAHEARERERREMKELTLAMNDRIQHQVDHEDPIIHPYHPGFFAHSSGSGGTGTQQLPVGYLEGDMYGMTNLTAIPPGHNAPP